jgi:two-component system CitB family response regulator/CitB family two-component system response regulator MalR
MTEQALDFSKLKIWIVEDDAPSIGLVNRLLGALGIVDFKVTTNMEAVSKAIAEGVDIDVIFIDVHLKKRSGYELLTQIQKDSRYDQTRCVMLSATSGQTGVRTAQRAEADGFITKPLTLDKLKRALTTVLQNGNFWE